MDRSLTVQLENQGPVTILHLGGFMAQLEVYNLKRQADRLITERSQFLIFDLTKVSFIDSAGIGVLMNTRAELGRIGGQMTLAMAEGSQPAQAINAAAIPKVIEVFSSAAGALDRMIVKYGLKLPAEAPGTAAPEALAERVAQLEQRLREVEARLAELDQQHPHPTT